MRSVIKGITRGIVRAVSGLSSLLDYLASLNVVFYYRENPRADGTLLSAIGSEERDIHPGRCYDFDGTNDEVALASPVELDGDFIVKFSVNIGDATERHLMSDSSTNATARIALTNAAYLALYGDAGGTIAFSGFSFIASTNYDVILKRIGTSVTLTVNGTLEGTQAFTEDVTLDVLGAVRGAATAWLTYDGKMWGVQIFKAGVEVVRFKCDEGEGPAAYDSSGNGSHGTITNATLSTFHAEQDSISYQNEVGYTDGDGTNGAAIGVFIPRDESSILSDVLGNSLEHRGKVKLVAKARQNSCGTFDGVDDEIQFAALAGGTTITSYEGTATPTIDTGNDKITVTAGTLWNILLSDGTHLPLAEGAGATIFDVSGNGNHGEATNITLATFWGTTQDAYAYNFATGFNKYMQFSTGQYVRNTGFADAADYFGACTISAKVYVVDRTTTQVVFALGSAGYRLYITGSNWTLNGSQSTSTAVTAGFHTVSVVFDSAGQATSFTLDGVLEWTGIAPTSAVGTTTLSVGCRAAALFWLGTIFDFSISGSSVDNVSWAGYGSTAADWLDTSGDGNHGEVISSPEAKRIPKLTTAATDAAGQTLRNTPLPTHNDFEGVIDYREVGVGDTTPPILSNIYEPLPSTTKFVVPNAFAFGDTVTNPHFQVDEEWTRLFQTGLDATEAAKQI